MKRMLTGLLIACFMLGMVSFAQGEDASLYFNKDSLTMSAGRYVTVYVYVSPAGALRSGVTFASSDPAVATVDADGKVRALNAGQAIITATSKYDETVTATLPVTVIVPAEQVAIQPDTDAILIGDTLQLAAAVLPENATMQNVVYTSSDEAVAIISTDGLVTGVAKGQTVIKAETSDGRAADYKRITIKQPPESVTVSPASVTIAEGKAKQLTPTVLPRSTDDKTVLWSSADEGVATVSDRGVVTGVQLGDTVISAVCQDNPAATFSVPVTVLKLATGVSFSQPVYDLLAGETLQLGHTVFPSTTSDQSVTYSVGNSRIATVDENGLLTAKKGGTTTVTITTADGSRKSASATIHVIVPVTGVTYPRTDIRVGQGYYGHFTVKLQPSDATDNAMTWEIADPSIATVSGDTTTFKIVGGDTYGRTTVTGTTHDGGYQITLNVNIGSLYRAIKVRQLEIRNGKPYITLENISDMHITQVRYYMRGLDAAYQPVAMSTTGDTSILYGTYDLPLYPGAQTQHGVFTFFAPSNYAGLAYLELVVTGWSTATGYYNSSGHLQYQYEIQKHRQTPATYPYNTDPALFETNE